MKCNAIAILILFSLTLFADDFDLKIENAVQINFQTEVGKIYQLESSPNVPIPVWTVQGKAIEGTGERHRVTFLTGDFGKQFYRIQELTNFDNGLIAFYPFNGNANDETSNQNDAIVLGARLAENRFRRPNSAYEFNGVNQYLKASHRRYLNFPNDGDFTISLWGLVKNPDASGVFIAKDDGGDNAPKWMLVYAGVPNQEAGMRVHFHIAPPPEWFASPLWIAPANTWVHFAVQKAGPLYSIFINGEIVSTTTANGLIPAENLSFLTIGQGEGGGFFNGRIDDIRIYNRRLTTNEIKTLNEVQE
jgi:hypothetical protein